MAVAIAVNAPAEDEKPHASPLPRNFEKTPIVTEEAYAYTGQEEIRV